MDKKNKHHEVKKDGEAARSSEMDCECDKRNECVCEEAKPKAPAAAVGAEKKEPDYYEQLLGLKADFENYRKRVEKERPEFVKFGKAEILLRLLPLYDMLMQAHLHVVKMQAGGEDGSTRVQDVVKGLEMIFKEFTKVFEAEGIRPMDVVGKPYDPMASEIIGIDEGNEENDGLVTAEFQKGFYYGDKILRPAKVKIAKVKAPAPEAPAAEKTDTEEKK
ncbi:MAG: nucleotide exchange factor GrpE [Elusimicrobia bacterium RIFOXYA12_FULL_51_18]|nr:MAG: nucleotide exchange factor GrpE [Elusimicrobia bacterium RIFOXYA12_FULL_51_18]OGS28808.1 MAG: nucleotide exchange factor GrpE [Elusimicrobia bacterium RIFOXYA2_FULL_53_38]